MLKPPKNQIYSYEFNLANFSKFVKKMQGIPAFHHNLEISGRN